MLKNFKQRFNHQKGFTLVELMVVIAILGILAAIAIPKFTSATAAANTAKIQADLRTLDSALIMYQADHSAPYPEATLTKLEPYLAETPKPPKGKCTIRSAEASIPDADVTAGYVIKISGTFKDAPRATFMGELSGAFGTGTTAKPT